MACWFSNGVFQMYRVILSRLLPFVLGAFAGVGAFYLLTPFNVPAPPTTVPAWSVGSGSSSFCKNRKFERLLDTSDFRSDKAEIPLRIISKPQAVYTDLARENGVEGSVRLKVTLRANGEVGEISVLRGLPDGLTEQAIAAARKIDFEPKKVNGVPTSRTVTIDYTFSIY